MRLLFGYSLIELLLVLGLMAGLVIMSFTASRTLYQYNASQVVVDRLISAVRLARIQAIMHGHPITLCGSSNGLNCNGDWQKGQIIIDARTRQLLKTFSALPENIVLYWQSSGNQPHLTFQSSGFTNGQQGRFSICVASEPAAGHAIIINHSGRARISDDALCPH